MFRRAAVPSSALRALRALIAPASTAAQNKQPKNLQNGCCTNGYPRKWPDRDERTVKATFEHYYGTMALYDLTRQWILKEGPFVCDFEWLMENHSQEHADAWANDSFRQVFGVALEDFEILS